MENILSRPSDREDNFSFERMLFKRGFSRIGGTDEVGRGPLAGPVVAACVILSNEHDHTLFRDSKRTTEKQRYKLRDILLEAGTFFGIGIVSAFDIDRLNILQASLLAMKESILDLSRKHAILPDFILVDGTFAVPIDIPQEALVKGDNRSASIAAASILAKLTRDEIMSSLHVRYPQYNFLSNKGYPTAEHRRAVSVHGPCPEHRCSFKGVKEFV